jgi:hypothetical protein
VKYALELRIRWAYLAKIHGIGAFLIKKSGRGKSGTLGKAGSSQNGEPPGDGGPDEAALFIAETVAALTVVARRHDLGMLIRLLEMAQMEAEEFIRLRGKRKLS